MKKFFVVCLVCVFVFASCNVIGKDNVTGDIGNHISVSKDGE